MNVSSPRGKALFIPHGGGPLPLLGDPAHAEMVAFLQRIGTQIERPEAIVVVSAHWEQDIATLTHGAAPPLLYDYSGFPPQSYQIQYPAPGHPALAEDMSELLHAAQLPARLDAQRGFDHGLFVPLKIMYPTADIPCVQLSLLRGLDAAAHVQMGRALSGLMQRNILVLGSGLSFHNMREFFRRHDGMDPRNEAFEDWLLSTCTDRKMSTAQRTQGLVDWAMAPFARHCHPREEHLLPMHVCYGSMEKPAQRVFDGQVLGKRCSAYLWS